MLIADNANAILYFWNASCSVCGPLYDKLEVMVNQKFPKLQLHKIDITAHPDLRVKYQVFSSPLILLLLDGKEYLRRNSAVSILELRERVERLYSLKYEA